MAAYVLRANNAAVRSICPACGADFKPSFGVWPFAPGTWTPLCEECATGPDATSETERAKLESDLTTTFPFMFPPNWPKSR
jgi:hypothetical protein